MLGVFRVGPSRTCAFLLLVALGACGDDSMPPPDAGECTIDADCSDGVFCSGEERCVAGVCESGRPPCPAPLLCDEAGGVCQSPGCDTAEDADGDGHPAIACGGDDCDDANADRYPGNPEICDDVDQDCDQETLGDLDADGDGAVSNACCDGSRCGPDCDDGSPAVGPTGGEACNGVDDDCDGNVDEGVLRSFYPDEDGDNFGDRDGTPVLACTRTDGLTENALDCDDASAAVNPTGLEWCNGIDDNCNGTDDDPDATALSCTASFGSPPNTFFACIAGACTVSECVAGHADCNGEPSDGCETPTDTDVDNCGACGNYCGAGGQCTSGVCDRVIDVAAGADYTCAVRSATGRVFCWGSNASGQLGDFSTTDRSVPVVVGPVVDATNVEVQRFGSDIDACPFTCAETGNLVYCWGCNRFGQMGDGDPEERSLMPEPVNDVPPVVSGVPEPLLPGLTLGGGHACALEGVGATPAATTCWGANTQGQLGSSCVESLCEATAIAGLPGGAADLVVAGRKHTCFLVGTTAYCVGNNDRGQLGVGDLVPRTTPVMVAGGHAFTTLSAGDQFTCGVRTDGAVLCWGDNGAGQLGNGNTTRRLTPTPNGVLDAVDVATARAHACALLDDGSVRCWGAGARGQLGHGSAANSLLPVTAMVSGLVQISTGLSHTCGLDSNGDVWCWGANERGQAGPLASGASILLPARVPFI